MLKDKEEKVIRYNKYIDMILDMKNYSYIEESNALFSGFILSKEKMSEIKESEIPEVLTFILNEVIDVELKKYEKDIFNDVKNSLKKYFNVDNVIEKRNIFEKKIKNSYINLTEKIKTERVYLNILRLLMTLINKIEASGNVNLLNVDGIKQSREDLYKELWMDTIKKETWYKIFVQKESIKALDSLYAIKESLADLLLEKVKNNPMEDCRDMSKYYIKEMFKGCEHETINCLKKELKESRHKKNCNLFINNIVKIVDSVRAEENQKDLDDLIKILEDESVIETEAEAEENGYSDLKINLSQYVNRIIMRYLIEDILNSNEDLLIKDSSIIKKLTINLNESNDLVIETGSEKVKRNISDIKKSIENISKRYLPKRVFEKLSELGIDVLGGGNYQIYVDDNESNYITEKGVNINLGKIVLKVKVKSEYKDLVKEILDISVGEEIFNEKEKEDMFESLIERELMRKIVKKNISKMVAKKF